ncbi:MAG: MATE family efflux transporter [Bacteroidia bacterium]|jgi:MATE family multidrug resistance protein|nr:MATE family efflux transporter [Bacteroidia bacterium]
MLKQVLPWSQHISSLLTLAIPVCLSNMGNIFVDLTDNYFVGQLPERTEAQAAISMAFAVYHFVLVLLIGTSYGLTPIVAAAVATGNKAHIGKHLQHALVINLGISLVLFTVLALSSPLFHYANKPEAVIDIAIRFLNVSILSMIPLSVFFTFKQFAEGMSDTRTAMVISISANLLNILLNWLLVFGNAGFPKLGVMGSCWATFISRAAMAVAMFAYIRLSKRYRDYRLSLWPAQWNGSIVREQLKIGVPSGLMFAMEVAAFTMPAFFIPGTAELAAHRSALLLASMTYLISSGLSAAAAIRTGHFLGLAQMRNVRRAGMSAVLVAVGVMSTAALCFIVFNHELPAIFNKNADVIAAASTLLLIGAVFQLFDGIQVTAQGALRGIKDTLVPGYIAFTAYWLVGLPLSYILCVPAGMGASGVWIGFVFGLMVSSGGFLWRFVKLTGKNKEVVLQPQ